MRRFKVGDRVRVRAGAGLDSGREGVIVPKSRVPTDGRCIPQLDQGHYHPMEDNEVAIEDTRGLFTMFKSYLEHTEG
jgi:hypothetical protein